MEDYENITYYNYTFSNTSTSINNSNDMNHSTRPPDNIALYKYYVPLMFFFCLLSIIVNIRVLLAVHWIRRPLSPTLHISLSLAAADACTSTLFGVGLVINSYLPVVFQIMTPCYISLGVEMFRLSGIIITVVHLLALSIIHWLGILKPLHYTTMITPKKVTILTIVLWTLPIVFFNIYFFTISEENFWTDGCSDGNNMFIGQLKFRVIFSSLFFVPLVLMMLCYAHILFIVKKQQEIWAKLSRSGSKRCKGLSRSNTQQKRTMEGNVKAVYTTLLILGSCMIGWLPGVINFLLVCSNCAYDREEINPVVGFFIAFIVNTLIILKTLANPIIYSARMIEIKEGMRRMQLALSRVFCNSNKSRDRYMSNLQPLQLGYSASMHGPGVTALCKLNGSASTRRSIRSNYPNTLV